MGDSLYPPLQGECPSHYSFISQELGIGVNLKLADRREVRRGVLGLYINREN